MRPLRTTLQSIGRFSSLTLNLGDIPENSLLVAYDGAPGAGKSTLFRALTWGSLFRKFKNSGSLKDLASGPDASLETVTEYGGKRYTIKHLVDGKQGASQLTCDGETSHDRAKRKDFKKAVEDTFPPELLLSNTVWRDQKSLGFLELEQSERRELILLATGATQWQKWFTEANAKVTVAQNEFRAACSAADALRGSYAMDGFEKREATLAELQAQSVLANEALAVAERELEAKRTELSDWERKASVHNAWTLSELERVGRMNAIENRLSNIVGHQMRLKTLTENGDAIRKAAAELERYRASLLTASTDAQQLKYNINLLTSFQKEYQRQIDLHQNLEEKIAAAENDIAACKQYSQMRHEVKLAIETREGGIVAAETSLAGTRERLLHNKDVRIRELRGAIESIIDDDLDSYDTREHCRTVIAKDNELRTDNISLPVAIERLNRDIAEQRSLLAEQRRELTKCERIAVDLQHSEERLASLVASRETLAILQADLKRSVNELREHNSALLELNIVIEARERVIQELRPLALQLPELTSAEATNAALQVELEELHKRLAVEQVEAPMPEIPGEMPSVTLEINNREVALNNQRVNETLLVSFKERKRIMEESHERVQKYEAAKLVAAREEADWRKLAILISRDGIQGALVDAAGPELSKTVNYFLHTCFGSRWTQTISTQRESSDGKKTIEQCKVWVVDQGSEEDNAPPREGEGITFSGGEQEILSLAFQLALTYLARNSGIVEPDIYLDEPASSLNESMREKWVHMLRVAAGLIGCKHIHFISHNEDVKRLADARVKIERGTAFIVQGDSNGQ